MTVFGAARFRFAAVLSDRKDWRTVISRRARRITGCHPGGRPGRWGEPGTPGGLLLSVRGPSSVVEAKASPSAAVRLFCLLVEDADGSRVSGSVGFCFVCLCLVRPCLQF